MSLRIEYCVLCNYRPMAASLALKVREATGVGTEYSESTNGAFEVYLDGELLFSKMLLGRFPGSDEIIAMVRRRLARRA